MFDLAELLIGVQDAEQRQPPQLPQHLDTLDYSEAVIDSRLATERSLFVALRGEQVDGHRFLGQAIRAGATAALVDRAQANSLVLDVPHAVITPQGAGLNEAQPGDVLLVAVEDPLAALQRLAAYHRGLFTPTVIGITGSVGKTSTKEVVASVLRRKYRTLKNPRSYNNETTMPIALLELNGDHDVAIFEMGIYGPGDLSLLASIARPSIGIVTNVGPSHMERMGSLDVVAQAKSELVQALPGDGVAILNYDDERVRAMAQVTPARVFSYGLDPAADIWADQIVGRGLEGISFRAHHAGEAVTLRLPLLGRHSVHTALAAAAAGLVLGLGWDAIVDGLRDESAQLRLLAVPGVNGATLIDDTYNASPVSSLAALNLLHDLEGRRIVVHGDMLELGPVEEESHRQVGRRVA
ncbi:MAG: UDP-N-acetylmuramoyl-tripeptide--D-alanyl-D-alanine ligase, partial [Roseiflexaceae bacterium]|nr:UDP-N-acetylmuramoyl-tripeptide--D-alanyl-D-alanine ligase [Roseiflexaceae bacterium]